MLHRRLLEDDLTIDHHLEVDVCVVAVDAGQLAVHADVRLEADRPEIGHVVHDARGRVGADALVERLLLLAVPQRDRVVAAALVLAHRVGVGVAGRGRLPRQIGGVDAVRAGHGHLIGDGAAAGRDVQLERVVALVYGDVPGEASLLRIADWDPLRAVHPHQLQCGRRIEGRGDDLRLGAHRRRRILQASVLHRDGVATDRQRCQTRVNAANAVDHETVGVGGDAVGRGDRGFDDVAATRQLHVGAHGVDGLAVQRRLDAGIGIRRLERRACGEGRVRAEVVQRTRLEVERLGQAVDGGGRQRGHRGRVPVQRVGGRAGGRRRGGRGAHPYVDDGAGHTPGAGDDVGADRCLTFTDRGDRAVLVDRGDRRVVGHVRDAAGDGDETVRADLGRIVADVHLGGTHIGQVDTGLDADVVRVAAEHDLLASVETEQARSRHLAHRRGRIDSAGVSDGERHVRVAAQRDRIVGVLTVDLVVAEGQVADALRVEHPVAVDVEGVAFDRHVLVHGVGGGHGRVRRLHQDRVGSAATERVAADRHVAGRAGFVPALRIVGDVDAGHAHAVEQVVLDGHLLAGGDQDAAGRRLLEDIVVDVDLGRVRDVLHHVAVDRDGGGDGAVEREDDVGQAARPRAHVTALAVGPVDGGDGAHGVGDREHVALGHELDLVADEERRESGGLVVHVAHLDLGVGDLLHHLQEGAMHVDRVVMRVGEAGVHDGDDALAARHLHEVGVSCGAAAGAFAGAFAGAEVQPVHRDGVGRLADHAEAVQEAEVDALERDVLVLPQEHARVVSRGLSHLIADARSVGELVAHRRVREDQPVVASVGDAGDVLEYGVGPYVAAHGQAGLRVIELHVRQGVACRPVRGAGVRAGIGIPFDVRARQPVVVFLGHVHGRGLGARIHLFDGQVDDRRHLEVHAEVLERHVPAVDGRERRHLAVEHEIRTLAVDGDVLRVLKQDADLLVLVGRVRADGVRYVQGAPLGLVGIDVVAPLGERDGDVLAFGGEFLGLVDRLDDCGGAVFAAVGGGPVISDRDDVSSGRLRGVRGEQRRQAYESRH